MAHKAEREAVKKVYNSTAWSKKVDQMPDDQLIAVYMRLRAQGKI